VAVVLPDCSFVLPPVGLSARQHRELVRLLAEEGPQALEAWLRKEEARDIHIRRRLAEARERLEREAKAEQRRAEQEHEDESRAAETEWERRMREQAEKEAALRSRLAGLASDPILTPEMLAERSALYRAVQEGRGGKQSVGRRMMAALATFWMFLVGLWVRFVRWLRGIKPKPPRTVLTLPAGAELHLRGLGPDALVAVRQRMQEQSWQERLKSAWDRLLGREDYAETVERMMAAELKRLEIEERARRAAEEAELNERLGGEKKTEEELRKAREAEARRRQEALERRLAELARRADGGVYDALREDLLGTFRKQGLVDAEGRPTARLMDRFSKLLYEEARRTIPAGGETQPGTYVEGEGEYEQGPLRSSHEMGAMDLVQSVLEARLHHPRVRHLYDDDVRVHREVRSATAHVVLVFDTSGSMDQQGRLDAVLHRAVKDRNRDHRVDLLAMHTSIDRVDLAGCWNAKPKGFTNHGAAMREARRLFEEGGADHKVLYLVTDGLPEAYTREDGVDKADRPDVCMEHALGEARRLRNVPGLRTVILQLETEEPLYLDAAAKLAEAAGGRVEGVDPQELMQWVLGDVDVTSTKAALA
jgi:Mg-chelatase subunit ChlD